MAFRGSGVVLASFVSALALVTQANASGFRILLTSFDPFAGRATNNTQAIVADLAASPGALGSGVTIETCNLPVIYDSASEIAMECVDETGSPPDAVVSFGEADCELRIETAATNWDDSPGFPDNADQVREDSEIIPGGPERSGFGFPAQAMFCALDDSSPPVMVSTSPGSFVCNNTAYHLSQELGARKIPFTFIHVPNSECSSEQRDPAVNAAAIARMLRAAIANLRGIAPVGTPWPHPGNSKLLPTTVEEAQALLNGLQNADAPACEQQFAQEIVSGY